MKQNITIVFSSVQFSRSVVSDSLRPHGPQHSRSPYPSQLSEFTQTHVHWVDDAIQPSHPLSSPSFAFNLSQHQSLLQWVVCSHQVVKASCLCSWGSHGKTTRMVCHSLFQWTMFCQNSPLWPVHFGWPCTAWLIASLSYASPLARTRRWSSWMASLI